LHHRLLARPATIDGAVGGDYPQPHRHRVELLGDIVADFVQLAAATRAGLVLEVDQAFDPLQVGRQMTTIALACGTFGLGGSGAGLVGAVAGGSRWRRCRVGDRGSGGRQVLLGVFQRQLELLRINLLGGAAEAGAQKLADHLLQPGDLGLGRGQSLFQGLAAPAEGFDLFNRRVGRRMSPG
jgi:hypothetical protein